MHSGLVSINAESVSCQVATISKVSTLTQNGLKQKLTRAGGGGADDGTVSQARDRDQPNQNAMSRSETRKIQINAVISMRSVGR